MGVYDFPHSRCPHGGLPEFMYMFKDVGALQSFCSQNYSIVYALSATNRFYQSSDAFHLSTHPPLSSSPVSRTCSGLFLGFQETSHHEKSKGPFQALARRSLEVFRSLRARFEQLIASAFPWVSGAPPSYSHEKKRKKAAGLLQKRIQKFLRAFRSVLCMHTNYASEKI